MASQLAFLLLPLPTSGYSHHSHQREPITGKSEDSLFRQNLPKLPPSRAAGSQSLYNALHHLPVLTCDSSFLRPLLWDNNSLLPSPKLAGRFLQGDFYNLFFPLPRVHFPPTSAQLSSSPPSGVYSKYGLLSRAVSGHSLKTGTHSPKHSISLSSSFISLKSNIIYFAYFTLFPNSIHRRHSIILAVWVKESNKWQ